LCTAGGGVKFAAYAPAGSLAPVRTEEAMAYDAEIAERLRDAVMRVGPAGVVDERKMFGGVALLLDGSMACGVIGTDLVVRTGEAGADEALRQPHARPMDFTGRPMKGFVYVAAPGFASEAALDAWVVRGVAGARGASRKSKAPPRAARPKRPRAGPA
jgi:TfoX/Sxy family transcriptional regulator of competence genes